MCLSSSSVASDCPSLVHGCSLWRGVCGVYSPADSTPFQGCSFGSFPELLMLRVHTVLFTLSFVPFALLLAVCFICIYNWLLSRDCEILTASTACVYQARNLIPGSNSKMPLQEQIASGYKRSHPVSWMPDVLFLSHISFIPVPLLPPACPGLRDSSRAFPRTERAKICQEHQEFVLIVLPWR